MSQVLPKTDLVLFAPRVHGGGGGVLLLEVLRGFFHSTSFEVVLFLDRRFEAALDRLEPEFNRWIRSRTTWLTPGPVSYLAPEWLLVRFAFRWKAKNRGSTAKSTVKSTAKLDRPQPRLFFFGNLGLVCGHRLARWILGAEPPSVIFVQNRFVLNSSSSFNFPWYRQLRLAVERGLFQWTGRGVDGFVVQSDSMKRELVSHGFRQPVSVQPFIDRLQLKTDSAVSSKVDFVFIASADPHKNHGTLLKAWQILAKTGDFPSLRLTVPESEPLGIWAAARELIKTAGCRIERVDFSASDTGSRARLYAGAKALVFPSYLESHGLPLVEARALGLGIVAAELDFVRDAVDPDETFDPTSPVSIARAVQRYRGIASRPDKPLNGEEFVNRLNSFYDSLP